MYCIHCGVKLADSETRCPLCHTTVFHPDIQRAECPPPYPGQRYPAPESRSPVLPMFATAAFLLPILIVLACDLRFSGGVTWSGYVTGALVLAYLLLVLPLWFRKPNPVIFVSCGFAAAGLYLLYIDLTTHGGWFLSFAFPVTGFFGIITVTVIALLRYVRRGRLYILGGAAIAVGAFMPLMEFLLYDTFHGSRFVGWSLYPLITLVFIGALLIFLAVCRPVREALERRLFI